MRQGKGVPKEPSDSSRVLEHLRRFRGVLKRMRAHERAINRLAPKLGKEVERIRRRLEAEGNGIDGGKLMQQTYETEAQKKIEGHRRSSKNLQERAQQMRVTLPRSAWDTLASHNPRAERARSLWDASVPLPTLKALDQIIALVTPRTDPSGRPEEPRKQSPAPSEPKTPGTLPNAPAEPPALCGPRSLHVPQAARRLNEYLQKKGLNRNQFWELHKSKFSPKAIRRLLDKGCAVNGVLGDIASAIGLTTEDLLKSD